MKGASGTAGDTGDSRVAVNVRVRVYPGTHGDVRGTVVEDFGDLAGHLVDIGENHFVGPARRWAVALDMGGAPGRMRVAHKCRKCQERNPIQRTCRSCVAFAAR
jgi:hypothetical protein